MGAWLQKLPCPSPPTDKKNQIIHTHMQACFDFCFGRFNSIQPCIVRHVSVQKSALLIDDKCQLQYQVRFSSLLVFALVTQPMTKKVVTYTKQGSVNFPSQKSTKTSSVN